jgi:hypothetical protein
VVVKIVYAYQYQFGDTALMHAAESTSAATVLVLLEYGANKEARDKVPCQYFCATKIIFSLP